MLPPGPTFSYQIASVQARTVESFAQQGWGLCAAFGIPAQLVRGITPGLNLGDAAVSLGLRNLTHLS